MNDKYHPDQQSSFLWKNYITISDLIQEYF